MSKPRYSSWSIWRIPVALAVLTVFGLLAALLGAGAWHWVAWIAMIIPIVVGLWHASRPWRPRAERCAPKSGRAARD